MSKLDKEVLLRELDGEFTLKRKTLEILCSVAEQLDNYGTFFDYSLYTEQGFLTYTATDPLRFEENMSEITDKLKLSGWTKTVGEKSVTYFASTNSEGTTIYITFVVSAGTSCTIKRVATGRVCKVTKNLTVEEPEYEYKIDCSGDLEREEMEIETSDENPFTRMLGGK